MDPQPLSTLPEYRAASKLAGKTALVTGGDSGIGRAVALHFAHEGANIAVLYLNEHEDAGETRRLVEETGMECLLIPGDIGDEAFCRRAVGETVARFQTLDILVNNAAEQHVQEDIADITAEQLERTFRTNIFSMFYLSKAALEYMPEGGAIVNTTSVTAYRGSGHLLDYSATKGAIVSFTRSLAKALAPRRIRVNAVAPGPVWTPLIPSTMDAERVAHFGQKTPMERAAEPAEIAACYVFLASTDSSYMTGQVLHPNGGDVING